MIVWCTQNLPRDGSSFSWHQPCNNQIVLSVHHFAGYYTTHYKRIQSLIQSHMQHQCSESSKPAQKQSQYIFISPSTDPSIHPLTHWSIHQQTDRRVLPQPLTLTSTQVWLVSASSMLAETWSWMAGPTQQALSITSCSPFSRFLMVLRTSAMPSRISESYSAAAANSMSDQRLVCGSHDFVQNSALTGTCQRPRV